MPISGAYGIISIGHVDESGSGMSEHYMGTYELVSKGTPRWTGAVENSFESQYTYDVHTDTDNDNMFSEDIYSTFNSSHVSF